MTSATLAPPDHTARAVDPDRVPRQALRFGVGSPFAFGDPADEAASVYPFSMQVRSAQPVDHWYWGRIVHDLSGVTPRGPAISIDWEHWSDEIIGYADKFVADESGLQISGNLISLAPGDRAHTVYRLSKNGVPFEGSIDWDDPSTEIQFVSEGDSDEVNGFSVAGPIHIVRKWQLNGAAVCRYGVDPNTRTQLSASSPEETRSVRLFSKESAVTKPAAAPAAAPDKPTIPAKGTKFAEVTIDTDDLAAAITAAVETLVGEASAADGDAAETPAADGAGTDAGSSVQMSLAKVRQFNKLFGAKAGEYLANNLTLPVAALHFVGHQRDEALTQLAAVTAERDELQTKLAQFAGDLGEPTPVDTGNGTTSSAADSALAMKIGERRAKFAATMKRRGEKS